MKIKTVTITGADNSVTPEEIVALSQEFPFVEWGILLSLSQVDGRRFPSYDWIWRLEDLLADHSLDNPVMTSAHLCGLWLRDVMKGNISCPLLSLGIFNRVQLNFHGKRHEVFQDAFLTILRAMVSSGRQIIFQWDGVNNYILNNAIANGIPGQALFDLSHGAGIAPAEWPEPLKHTPCGYAGGLGPDNLARELERINAKVGDAEIWIDMETKVRSNNDRSFDLAKVRECLEIAKPWTEEAA